MEDILVWIFWVAIIIGSIVSSASKAKKKQEEETRRAAEAARRAAEARGTAGTRSSAGGGYAPDLGAGGADPWDAKPAGGTFGRVLEELSRQLSEQPSPPVVSRPLSKPILQPANPSSAHPSTRPMTAPASSVPRPMVVSQPEATSHDYYSLEEDSDAEQRYVGGEIGYFEDEIAAYERLAAERARRSTLDIVKTAPTSAGRVANFAAAATATGTTGATVSGASSAAPSPDSLVSPDAAATPPTLRELLGGDFDLRRAIIEAEILTSKYVSHN
jgi:type II secretory pathway pseudopilin PulG